MKKFTTILWDVDGTLLDFLYSQRIALKNCLQIFDRECTEELRTRYSQINDNYWKRYELGEITREELLTGRFRTLFEEFDICGIDPEAFCREYQRELGNVYCYIDDSLDICKSLYGKVKQYVVTNGAVSTQKNKLKLSGLSDVMEEIFVSDEVGTPKPDKGFFDYCLAHVEEKDPKNILLVGDSLSSDIKGGVMAGIPTCWFRPEGTENHTEYKSDYEISNLHQIFEVLQMDMES